MSNREEIDKKIYNYKMDTVPLNMAIIFSFLSIVLKFYGIYVYSGKVAIVKTVLVDLAEGSAGYLITILVAPVLALISTICFKYYANLKMVVIPLAVMDLHRIYLYMHKSISVWEVIVLSCILLAFVYTWLDNIKGAKYTYYVCLLGIVVYLYLYMEVYGSLDFIHLENSYFDISNFLSSSFVVASFASMGKAISEAD